MNCLSLGFCFFIQWMNVNMKINITFESNNNNHSIQIIIMMLPFFCFVLSSYISLFGQSVNVWFALKEWTKKWIMICFSDWYCCWWNDNKQW